MGQFREAMDEAMVLRGLSPRTREIYLGCVERLVRFSRVRPDRLTANEVRAYLLDLTRERNAAFSTFNLALHSVRFFFTEVLKRPLEVGEFHLQKQPRRLPVVMSDDEVRRLFEAAHSLRDRALFETAYATGMRVSEVTRLRVSDIDSTRMVIRVELGKGGKDRYVMLAASLLETLRGYWRQARPKPPYLFPGEGGQKPLSLTSAQKAFARARRAAGITKPVSFHTLRHSFATHLLEDGVNVRPIQSLLGHRSLQTTQRYTHVAADSLHLVRSPLDRLNGKETPAST
jgi:site-specific recombinase XerD